MKNIWIMTLYTLREALARKVLIFFLGFSLLVLLGMLLFMSLIDTSQVMEFFANRKEGTTALKEVVSSIQMMVIAPLANLGLLLAIFSCASFVPIMLEKGNIDLLISKPVSRSQLLLGKYIGGVLFVIFNIAFLIGGVWLIISLKFNYWDGSLLLTILSISFTFAVLYALIVFFGVVTKSSIVGMMTAYFIFLIASPLLFTLKENEGIIITGEFLQAMVDGLYYIIPKTSELMSNITFDLAMGKGIENFQPVISSFLFLGFIMALGIYLFEKKDF